MLIIRHNYSVPGLVGRGSISAGSSGPVLPSYEARFCRLSGTQPSEALATAGRDDSRRLVKDSGLPVRYSKADLPTNCVSTIFFAPVGKSGVELCGGLQAFHGQ